MMQFSERDVVEAIEAIAKQYDRGAVVFVSSREPLAAQAVDMVEVKILTQPNNSDLVSALKEYGISTADEVKWAGSQVVMGEDTYDELTMTAKVYYKRGN